MQNLNPTLWRTCKMLAGQTRIRLLRQLFSHPGECVSALGKRAEIKVSAASQELRRIQSRGLLQAERRGVHLIYRLAADPQVSSAAPLLKAIQTACATLPPERDGEMAVIAAGLAHERRIRIVRALLGGSLSKSALQCAVRIPDHPFHAHVDTLLESGFVIRSHNRLHVAVPDHPLAKALAKLLRQGAAR
jgi:DNA-binding transcriptional ArsR family regulator